MFERGVESMKTATRQYAKRQVKWIKSKLLPAVHQLGDAAPEVTVALLDVSGAFLTPRALGGRRSTILTHSVTRKIYRNGTIESNSLRSTC